MPHSRMLSSGPLIRRARTALPSAKRVACFCALSPQLPVFAPHFSDWKVLIGLPIGDEFMSPPPYSFSIPLNFLPSALKKLIRFVFLAVAGGMKISVRVAGGVFGRCDVRHSRVTTLTATPPQIFVGDQIFSGTVLPDRESIAKP